MTGDINMHFPPRGPCAFCGFHDARHRIFDTIIDSHNAGQSVDSIASEYELSILAVACVIKERPYQQKRGDVNNKCPCDLSGTSECNPLNCPLPSRVWYTEDQITRALERSGLTATCLIAGFWQKLRGMRK